MELSTRIDVAAGVVLLVVLVALVVRYRASDEPGTTDLTAVWGGGEGVPSCAFEPEDRTVVAKVRIEGEAPQPTTVTVTVTAYADENTSQPVGSGTRSVEVEGTVQEPLLVTIPVEEPPHRGEDGETACRLSVTY